MPLEAGTALGRYVVRSFIGAGGMGEVYLAEDTQLERPVALKVIGGALAADEDRLRRFAQEARAASALNHPHILTIYEIGGTDSLRFIAAEYVAGLTLRRLMSNAPLSSLPAVAVFDIALQIAAALGAAHAAGIVHRDIKPENVMLRTDGYVKVLDFGLAKLTGEFVAERRSDPDAPTRRDVITNPGVVMGTVYYMSPEQARGLDVDARSDIWSLGVVIYELLTGRVPFPGETSSDVIAAVLERQPPRLERYLDDARTELQRITGKMLAKDREERYQTVKDLLIDMKALKHELEAEAARTRPYDAKPTNEDKSEDDKEGDDGKASDETNGQRPISSAEYIITGLKRHRRAAAFALALPALVLVVFLGYSMLAPRTPIDSVAIMPFVNGAGPELEPFGDGLTDSVINNLTTAGVKVKSRHAAFSYKGKEVDPLKAGRELGVRAVLTGRIEKQGDALIIKAALVDVDDDFQLWGKQYPIYDLVGGGRFLVLQEDISKQITDDMKTKIVTEQR